MRKNSLPKWILVSAMGVQILLVLAIASLVVGSGNNGGLKIPSRASYRGGRSLADFMELPGKIMKAITTAFDSLKHIIDLATGRVPNAIITGLTKVRQILSSVMEFLGLSGNSSVIAGPSLPVKPLAITPPIRTPLKQGDGLNAEQVEPWPQVKMSTNSLPQNGYQYPNRQQWEYYPQPGPRSTYSGQYPQAGLHYSNSYPRARSSYSGVYPNAAPSYSDTYPRTGSPYSSQYSRAAPYSYAARYQPIQSYYY